MRSSVIRVILAASLISAMGGGETIRAQDGDTPAPSTQPEGELSPELRKSVEILRAPDASAAERGKAARALLESRNPQVIPALLDGTAAGTDKFRRAVVMGLVSTFPDQAFDALSILLDSGNPRQRETGAFAFSLVKDPRVVGRVAPYLRDESPRVRQGATYSLVMQGRPAYDAAYNRAQNKDVLVEAADRSMFHAVRAEALRQLLLPKPTDEIYQLFQRVAGSAEVAASVAHYREQLPEDEKEWGALLEKIRHANRFWLGRPEYPRVESVRLRFEMVNLVVSDPTPKSYEVRTTAEDADFMTHRGQSLARVSPLTLPLDDLVVLPQVAEPRLEKTEEGARIRYKPPLRGNVIGGVGWLNIYYWRGQLATVTNVELLVDPERGVPLREVYFGAGGAQLGDAVFGNYRELAPGAWVPGSIVVSLESPQALKTPMVYEYEFQVAPPGVWLLEGVRASAVGEAGLELRATGDVRDLAVTPLPEEPKEKAKD